MNIQFIAAYPDTQPDRVWLPGWVTKMADPDAQRLVDEGYAVQVDEDVRGRMYTVEEALHTDCIPDGTDAAPADESDEQLSASLTRQAKPASQPDIKK